MKSARFILFIAAVLASGWLPAQSPAPPLIEPVAAPANTRKPETSPAIRPPAVPTTPPADTSGPVTVPGAPLTITPGTPAATPPGTPEQPKQELQKSDEGYILKDAPLNDIFQFLAKSAGRQYFHNAKINSPEFLVTGHLNDGNPLEQMEELAFMYGLTLHTKGSTIYALTQAQLAQLPSIEFHYQLRYLRPLDIEKIKDLIKPMLSPGTGIVNFEPKTNPIVIIDSTNRIEQARQLLHGIDKAKGQIIIETRILSINSNASERTGINWAGSLGSLGGTSIKVTRDLSSIFGLKMPSTQAGAAAGATPASTTAGTNLVLSPIEISGVLRALDEGGLTKQISNPTLITEDNEQATMSIIARNPIITTTQAVGTSGSGGLATEEVRYKIDTADKSIDTDPDKHREIGVSMVVTPTLLPDGTIRMKLRPRSASIIGSVTGKSSGNSYPIVSESMLECIARVPDGYSLVVGGFFSEAVADNKTKIPLLGDIPVINFFFKSKEATNAKTSLVFIVTPRSYDPTNHAANNRASSRVHSGTTLDCDHNWVDPDNPGPAHEPNLKRTLRGMQPTQAPYYPRTAETSPTPTPTPAPQTRFSRAGHN